MGWWPSSDSSIQGRRDYNNPLIPRYNKDFETIQIINLHKEVEHESSMSSENESPPPYK